MSTTSDSTVQMVEPFPSLALLSSLAITGIPYLLEKYDTEPVDVAEIVDRELATLTRNPRLLDKCGSIPADCARDIAKVFRDFALKQKLNQEHCKHLYQHLCRSGVEINDFDFTELPVRRKFIIKFVCNQLGLDVETEFIYHNAYHRAYHLPSILHGLDLSRWAHSSGPSAYIYDTLNYLDLSGFSIEKLSLKSNSSRLTNLETLIITDQKPNDDVLKFICQQKKLKKLYLSRSYSMSRGECFSEELEQIIRELPELMWVDVSVVDLTYAPYLTGEQLVEALSPRRDKPLDYLGIVGLFDDHVELPARKVGSFTSADECLNVLEVSIRDELSDLLQSNFRRLRVKYAPKFEFDTSRVLQLAHDCLTYSASEAMLNTIFEIISKDKNRDHFESKKALITAFLDRIETERWSSSRLLSYIAVMDEFSIEHAESLGTYLSSSENLLLTWYTMIDIVDSAITCLLEAKKSGEVISHYLVDLFLSNIGKAFKINTDDLASRDNGFISFWFLRDIRDKSPFIELLLSPQCLDFLKYDFIIWSGRVESAIVVLLVFTGIAMNEPDWISIPKLCETCRALERTRLFGKFPQVPDNLSFYSRYIRFALSGPELGDKINLSKENMEDHE